MAGRGGFPRILDHQYKYIKRPSQSTPSRSSSLHGSVVPFRGFVLSVEGHLGRVMFSSSFDVLFCCKGAIIFVSLTVHVAIARPPCHVNQITIQSPEGTNCVDCLKCPEGQGLSPQCGSYVKPGLKIECVKCPAGVSYSDVDDILSCRPCSICGPNEETLQACTPTKNAICGKCKKGFYREVTGDCQPCSQCCGRDDDDVIEECTNQGLSNKESCRYNLDTISCARKDSAMANKTDTRGKSSPDFVAREVGNSEMLKLFVVFGVLGGVVILALALCGVFILCRCVRPRCHKAVSKSSLKNNLIQCEQQQGQVTPNITRVQYTPSAAGDHDSLPKVVIGTAL